MKRGGDTCGRGVREYRSGYESVGVERGAWEGIGKSERTRRVRMRGAKNNIDAPVLVMPSIWHCFDVSCIGVCMK